MSDPHVIALTVFVAGVLFLFILVVFVMSSGGRMTEEEFVDLWKDYKGKVRTWGHHIHGEMKYGFTTYETNTTWAGETREQAIFKMHCEMCRDLFKAGGTPPERNKGEA